jgi:PAS domain S-box-containing protein
VPTPSSGNWTVLYQQALLETDAEALPGRIHLARASVRARLREDPEPGERSSLGDALRNLSAMEQEHHHSFRAGDLQPTPYVTLSSPDHHWLGVSDGICTLLGYARDELVGRVAREVVPPELEHATEEVFRRLLAEGRASGTHVVQRKDGTRVPIDFHARTFPDGSIISYWYPKGLTPA